MKYLWCGILVLVVTIAWTIGLNTSSANGDSNKRFHVVGEYQLDGRAGEKGVDPSTIKAQLWTAKVPGSKSSEKVNVLQEITVIDGKFEIEVDVEYIQLAGLSVNANDGEVYLGKVDLVLEPGRVDVNVNERTVKGGDYYDLLETIGDNSPEYLAAQDRIRKLNDDFKSEGSEEEQEKLKAAMAVEYEARRRALKKAAIRFMDEQKDPIARFLYLSKWWVNGLSAAERLEHFEALQSELSNYPPLEYALVRSRKSAKKEATANAIKIGSVIKDFEANDLAGENFRVRDVMSKNKYVLVEFWASWCGPCRAEIPHMKEAYQAFHGKGFEIVSFSLDDDRESWQAASEEELLPWINTGDLKAFESPVVEAYGVQGIPTNYLVEGSTGKIVGKNLRGKSLDKKLTELLSDY